MTAAKRHKDQMGFFEELKKRSEDPEGFLGGLMLYGTNRLRAKTLSWGLSLAGAKDPKEIADLGCGSGRNVAVLLTHYPGAKVTAVEESPYQIEKITRNNQRYIIEGRCVVQREKLSDLKLEKGSCDLAVAFDTISGWQDLRACFAQVAAILKPKGSFLVVNETDGSEIEKIRYEKSGDSLTSYNEQEIEDAMTAAGFSEVRSMHHSKERWIAVAGRKQ